MAKKKRRPRPPNMLVWDRNQQTRFIDAVEKLVAGERRLDRSNEQLAAGIVELRAYATALNATIPLFEAILAELQSLRDSTKKPRRRSPAETSASGEPT